MSSIIAWLGAWILSTSSAPLAPPELRSYAVDHDASHLYVVVHRAGLLSFLGHDHAVVPGEWSAELCLGDPPPAEAHATLVVKTASLVIDSDSARALAGLGSGPGAEDREDIQERMLGSTNLDASEFPEIRLELHGTEAADADDAERVAVEGTITIRDTSRDFELPVDVRRTEDGPMVLSGVLRIQLRDFGIEPESRVGLVKVSNDVDLHFEISASRTERPCPGATDGARDQDRSTPPA
ncbi:MAG: YceI family protein [Gemmatimonadota bacterium]